MLGNAKENPNYMQYVIVFTIAAKCSRTANFQCGREIKHKLSNGLTHYVASMQGTLVNLSSAFCLKLAALPEQFI